MSVSDEMIDGGGRMMQGGGEGGEGMEQGGCGEDGRREDVKWSEGKMERGREGMKEGEWEWDRRER